MAMIHIINFSSANRRYVGIRKAQRIIDRIIYVPLNRRYVPRYDIKVANLCDCERYS